MLHPSCRCTSLNWSQTQQGLLSPLTPARPFPCLSLHRSAARDSGNLTDPFMHVNNWLTRHLATLREPYFLPPFTRAWLNLFALTFRALGRSHLVARTAEIQHDAMFQLNSWIPLRRLSSMRAAQHVAECGAPPRWEGGSPRPAGKACPRQQKARPHAGDARGASPRASSPRTKAAPAAGRHRRTERQGDPASGAIASSQGTRPICRLPLAALHPLTRDDLPWRPAAVIGTVPASSWGPLAPGDLPWKERASPRDFRNKTSADTPTPPPPRGIVRLGEKPAARGGQTPPKRARSPVKTDSPPRGNRAHARRSFLCGSVGDPGTVGTLLLSRKPLLHVACPSTACAAVRRRKLESRSLG